MANTPIVTWNIKTFERNLSDGVVFNVHYTVDATDGTYSSGAYGSVALPAPGESDTVIPYADLTKEWAITAVKEQLGSEQVAQIEEALSNAVEEQRTPTVGTGVPF